MKLESVLNDEKKQKEVIRSIKEGKTFIYPTDTVYGLGCDAENSESVNKIRGMKKSSKPLSIIAPSIKWIKENLVVIDSKYLQKLPGPYTIIFKKKTSLLHEVSSEKLGVRIPYHPLTKIIQKSGKPFVTTSCNISGRKTITTVREIPEEIKVDIVIDGGILNNDPSKVIDLSGKVAKIIR